MKARRQSRVFLGMVVFWCVGFLVSGGIPKAKAGDYDVVSTRVRYLPQYPCHIDDPRYDKSNFETRTVVVLQPTRNGEPLRRRPVVFFVHGGAWTEGYADMYTDVLTPALVQEQGWVVVNVDYRLTSSEVTFANGTTSCPTPWEEEPIDPNKVAWYDENLQDVAAAFQWTVRNIDRYGGDVNNIFLFGHSAGGHLVSLLATRGMTEDDGGFASLRRWMRGVISLSGVYNLNGISVLFNGRIDETFPNGHWDKAALQEASPTTYVQEGASLPPFYILHCQHELPSLARQAIFFRLKLQALGFDVEWDYLPGYTHVSEIKAVADPGERVTQKIVDYITNHVRETITSLPPEGEGL